MRPEGMSVTNTAKVRIRLRMLPGRNIRKYLEMLVAARTLDLTRRGFFGLEWASWPLQQVLGQPLSEGPISE